MFEHPFGHFSCVLVDINLVAPPIFNVLVERQGFDFIFLILNMKIYLSFTQFVSLLVILWIDVKELTMNLISILLQLMQKIGKKRCMS